VQGEASIKRLLEVTQELTELEGLLAVVGLEVTTEGIRAGTGTEKWRERVPNFRGCNAEAANAK